MANTRTMSTATRRDGFERESSGNPPERLSSTLKRAIRAGAGCGATSCLDANLHRCLSTGCCGTIRVLHRNLLKFSGLLAADAIARFKRDDIACGAEITHFEYLAGVYCVEPLHLE